MTEEKPSSVQKVKKEKRDREVGVESGVSRRGFLTFLGAGSAALAAGSAGVFPKEAAARAGAREYAGGASTPYREARLREINFFSPIAPSAADELILPPGFRYDIIRKWGEPVTSEREFGFNNDYVAYFPIDALQGGLDSRDGLLWVNHEYVDSKWVSGFDDSNEAAERSPRQIAEEKAAVGGSVIRVARNAHGRWEFVADETYNRRLDATSPMGVTGPAAGSAEMKMEGESQVIGTLGNCSGGVTPWNTVLSAEENYQYYYGTRTPKGPEDDEATADATWLADEKNAQPPEHYGWVVEVDPFDSSSTPRKHTWLGRVRHENVAMTVTQTGRVVAYTGHDEEDQRIYKFVSSGVYDPGNRAANMELLTDGMLYVADFAQGRWTALDYESNPIFKNNGFTSQADVLVRTAEAAAIPDPETELPIGTPLDRCEDIEIHPDTGTIYAALTNNALHGNFHGQIIRMYEAGGDPEATEFVYEVFAAGGPNTGFSSPDNLAFDSGNNLWMVTDISSSEHNKGIYKTFKNNGMFVIPEVSDDAIRGEPLAQFASAPVEAEMTGPAFTPDGTTLFLSVQHPGEESESVKNPTSTWPHDGDGIPKPSVVAITGFA